MKRNCQGDKAKDCIICSISWTKAVGFRAHLSLTRWGVILSKVSSSDGTQEFETISSEPQNCPHFHLIKPFDGEFDNLSYAYATLANRPMNLITYPMQP